MTVTSSWQPAGPGKATGPPLEGRYANYFEVGHNAAEIVIIFGQCYTTEEQRSLMHTRIITSPERARALLELLRASLECHQASYGLMSDSCGEEKDGAP